MFSEGHNNGIVEGTPIDRDHVGKTSIVFEKEDNRRFFRHGHGLSVCLQRYHYYVRESSALYKILAER